MIFNALTPRLQEAKDLETRLREVILESNQRVTRRRFCRRGRARGREVPPMFLKCDGNG